jgi:hypothetical protein
MWPISPAEVFNDGLGTCWIKQVAPCIQMQLTMAMADVD